MGGMEPPKPAGTLLIAPLCPQDVSAAQEPCPCPPDTTGFTDITIYRMENRDSGVTTEFSLPFVYKQPFLASVRPYTCKDSWGRYLTNDKSAFDKLFISAAAFFASPLADPQHFEIPPDIMSSVGKHFDCNPGKKVEIKAYEDWKDISRLVFSDDLLTPKLSEGFVKQLLSCGAFGDNFLGKMGDRHYVENDSGKLRVLLNLLVTVRGEMAGQKKEPKRLDDIISGFKALEADARIDSRTRWVQGLSLAGTVAIILVWLRKEVGEGVQKLKIWVRNKIYSLIRTLKDIFRGGPPTSPPKGPKGPILKRWGPREFKRLMAEPKPEPATPERLQPGGCSPHTYVPGGNPIKLSPDAKPRLEVEEPARREGLKVYDEKLPVLMLLLGGLLATVFGPKCPMIQTAQGGFFGMGTNPYFPDGQNIGGSL